MDHRNNRSKMDFFLRPAKTAPPPSSDAGSEGKAQAAGLGRAGTAPAAAGASEHMSNMHASAATASLASDGPAADPEAENEEALYWKHHGEVEEDMACEDAWDWGKAGDLDHLGARWQSEPEEDEKPDEGDGSDCPVAAKEEAAACKANAIKSEPEASCAGCGSTAGDEEPRGPVLYSAGAKHGTPEQGAAGSEGCVPKQAQDASLQRFSYSGSRPLKNEYSSSTAEHDDHAVHRGSQHSRVLENLGLASPRAQLPSSMAPLCHPTCPPDCRGFTMQGQPISKTEQDGPPQVGRQHVHAPIKQEDCSSTCQAGPGTTFQEGEALLCKAEKMSAQQEHPQGCASPDSWATASEGSQQNSQQQQAPQFHAKTHGNHCLTSSSPQVCSKDCPVTDICSPEPAPCRASPRTKSLQTAKGELSSRGTMAESQGIQSPGPSDCIDLSAVDLAEQQRILGIIAAQRTLQKELQASRACPQPPSARACPEQSANKRSRAVTLQPAALPGVGPMKRRQLGIGAFLLTSQQRSDRR